MLSQVPSTSCVPRVVAKGRGITATAAQPPKRLAVVAPEVALEGLGCMMAGTGGAPKMHTATLRMCRASVTMVAMA